MKRPAVFTAITNRFNWRKRTSAEERKEELMPKSANDVAQYIIKKTGPMTAMKLQKLLYYSQAWSLVWDEKPLFSERIEAWANGPIVADLYPQHRGMFQINEWPSGNAAALESEQTTTVDSVLKFYGDKTGQWLSELTHREEPWKTAREGLSPGERGNNEISLASMAEYYGSL